MHNGLIRDFQRVKRELALAVEDSLYPCIEGTTDSELMFYLALSFGLEEDPIGRSSDGRLRGADRSRARRRAPDSDDDRDDRRALRVGVPVLQ